MAVMADKEDLGLSLSLGTAAENHGRHLFQLPPAVSTQKPHWMDLLTSSLVERGLPEETTARPLLRGIDVNRAPAEEREMEEETGVSSPNSTVSSVSGKRGRREESENDRAFSGGGGGGGSDEEDGGEGSRKKLRLSKDQSAVLEESFKEQSTLNPKQKMALAKKLNLRPRQVEVWFQNRRARTKLKQTEVDCEFLKRCCENLTEENRRLQKEVQELRALKLSPQFYMQMTPPTTLTMCPSCERVAVSNTSTTPPQIDGQNHSNNSRNGNSGITRQIPQPQQHHPFFQHRPIGPALPWAPTQLRTAKFFDASSQRS